MARAGTLRSRLVRGAVALVLLALAAGAGFLLWQPLGPPLVDVISPGAGERVGIEVLEVMVRFPHQERTRHETLRVLLNGADVTSAFTTADNGAVGELYALVEGENVLEVSVFGTSWLGRDRLVEHTRTVPFQVFRAFDANWG